MIVFYIIFFVFGLVFGSFLNVVGLRLPNNESIVYPGSHCPKCNHKLKWYELIPLFSFLFLGGKCKKCKSQISPIYPFNELVCGILFVVCYYSWGFSANLIISLILSGYLIVVIASDLSYMVIPDVVTVIACILIVLVKLFGFSVQDSLISIGYGAISFGVTYLLLLLGNLIFKKESLGGGDVKLMFLSGIVLSPIIATSSAKEMIVYLFMPFLVITIASFIALVPSLFLYFKKSEHLIPFGPFLVIGMLIIFFTKIDMSSVINFLINF